MIGVVLKQWECGAERDRIFFALDVSEGSVYFGTIIQHECVSERDVESGHRVASCRHNENFFW